MFVAFRCVRTVEEDNEMIEEEDRLCDQKTKPRDTNHCHVPCSNQCVVSSWTEWTKCPEQCQSHTRRQRSRTVIRPPDPASSSGVQCPLLEEFDRCDLEPRCDVYAVLWTDWGPCIPHQNMTCGSGTRQRFSECLRSDGNVVSKEFCHRHSSELELLSDEPCTSPCPVDCVVSEWSLWSPCSITCGLGFQERSRTVLVHPDNRGRHCPDPLTQRKYCPFKECFQWRLNDWGNCEIEDDSCGYGLQHRSVGCFLLDNVDVDLELCDPKLLPTFTLTKECLVPCPGDCQLSDWSSWSACLRTCDERSSDIVGQQTRSRVILTFPGPEKESCPLNLIETRRCSPANCPHYTWQTGNWVENKRLVWCQDETGGKVLGGCSESERPSTVKACHPPCAVTHSECRTQNLCICKRGYDPVYRSGQLVNCEDSVAYGAESDNRQSSNNLALYRPYDISTDAWMYSIMASGLVFIVLLITAIYVVCWKSRAQRNVPDTGSDDERLDRNQTATRILDRNSDRLPKKMVLAEKPPQQDDRLQETVLRNSYNCTLQSEPTLDPYKQMSYLSYYTKCSNDDFYPSS